MDDIVKVMYIMFLLVPIKHQGDFLKQWSLLKTTNFGDWGVRVASVEFVKKYGINQHVQQTYWLEILRDHYG